jgi:hypothetical protein
VYSRHAWQYIYALSLSLGRNEFPVHGTQQDNGYFLFLWVYSVSFHFTLLYLFFLIYKISFSVASSCNDFVSLQLFFHSACVMSQYLYVHVSLRFIKRELGGSTKWFAIEVYSLLRVIKMKCCDRCRMSHCVMHSRDIWTNTGAVSLCVRPQNTLTVLPVDVVSWNFVCAHFISFETILSSYFQLSFHQNGVYANFWGER